MKRAGFRSAGFVGMFLVALAAATAGIPIERVGDPIEGNLSTLARVRDAWWYGTPTGVYVRPDSGVGAFLAGVTGTVLAIAPVGTSTGSSWIVAGTDGAWRVGATAERIAWPAGATRSPVTSIASTGSSAWLGGPSGLLRLEGAVAKPVEVPTAEREVLALASTAPSPGEANLLVAFPDGVRLLSVASGGWKDVLPGVRCERLLAGPGGAWMAVTTEGNLIRGSTQVLNTSSHKVYRGVTPILLEGSPDAATALSRGGGQGENEEVLVGTWRGRVFTTTWSSESAREIFSGDPATAPQAAPVAALVADGAEGIRIASAGMGPLDLYRTPDGARVEPHPLDVAHAAASVSQRATGEAAVQSGWRARAMAFLRDPQKAVPSLTSLASSRSPWMLFLGLGVLLVVAGALRAFSGGGRGEARRSARRRKREVAAATSGPPLIQELSPEVAAQAEKFRALTLRIDDLSRDAARGLVESAKVEARRASVELVEVEGWMRQRLADAEPALVRHRALLAELDRDEGAEVEERRAALESQVVQEEKDCTYLRYILEG